MHSINGLCAEFQGETWCLVILQSWCELVIIGGFALEPTCQASHPLHCNMELNKTCKAALPQFQASFLWPMCRFSRWNMMSGHFAKLGWTGDYWLFSIITNRSGLLPTALQYGAEQDMQVNTAINPGILSMAYVQSFKVKHDVWSFCKVGVNWWLWVVLH